MTPAVTLAELRRIDLFDEVDDAALERWVGVVEERHVEADEVIAEQDVPPPGLLLLLDGTARTLLVSGERSEPVGHQHAPTWVGAIAVLTEGPFGVRMVAETPCRVGVLPAKAFLRLAFDEPAVHRTVMRQVAPVMSRITAVEQSRERLASLGTMAAGLAHELNNPAAAAGRAAAQLAEALDIVTATLGRFVEAGIERSGAEQLLRLHAEAIERAAARTRIDALDAADAEDELLDELTRLGVGEPWRIAEPLAAAGVDADWLQRVAAIAGTATDAAVRWVAATLTARALAEELQEATRRMSALVGAVKSYTFVNRGELVEADLHEGLETTLAVLGYKLRKGGVQVVRDYDRRVPRLVVRGSELNQVWTNLLDNAIAAVDGDGTITIATRLDGDHAEVDISDDGPGIPPDIRDRVFDSFFTTKEVGQGTGLGLATARQIVVDRHDGSLTFDSQPGRTTFHVSLPLAQRPSGGS